MRPRLVLPLLLVALLTAGCFVVRGEVVLEEPSAEPPRPAPPLPSVPEATPTAAPDAGTSESPDDGPGSAGQDPTEVAPERNDNLAQEVEPVPGAVDPRPVPWTSARVDRQAMTLTVTWTSGVEPCTVLSHVDVDYGVDQVVVTVFEGAGPDAATQTCIAIAVEKQTTVPLDEDVGTRSLVDGADS